MYRMIILIVLLGTSCVSCMRVDIQIQDAPPKQVGIQAEINAMEPI